MNPPRFGDTAPWFYAATSSNPRYGFHTVAGRHVLLVFLGTLDSPAAQIWQLWLQQHRAQFDDQRLCAFGVAADTAARCQAQLMDQVPGLRFFHDPDRAISQLYGACDAHGPVLPYAVLLDPNMRVMASYLPDPEQELAVALQRIGAQLSRLLQAIPTPPPPYVAPPFAPVLVMPRIFEPGLCDALIAYYERQGGQESGFMRDVNGKTVQLMDYGHKRRRDCSIDDERLRQACMERIHDRLAPQIQRAFQFQATRIERHIVSCYDASEQGHFRPHRDNTTRGTAHRRFAVSLFLNTGDYEGGMLRFAEFGPALYSAPKGGAVVFSCSLLHEALPVTRGKRYMYVPFLYDEAARQIRDQNLDAVDLSET